MLLLCFVTIVLQISNLGAIPGKYTSGIPGVTRVEVSFTSTEGKQLTGKIAVEASGITWIQPNGVLINVDKTSMKRYRKVGFLVSRAKFEEKLNLLRITSDKFFQMMKSPTVNWHGTCYNGQESIELSNPLSAKYADVIDYVPKEGQDDSYGTFEDGPTRKEVRSLGGLGGYLYVEGYLRILNDSLTYEDVAAGKY